jgi:hypothetical protein
VVCAISASKSDRQNCTGFHDYLHRVLSGGVDFCPPRPDPQFNTQQNVDGKRGQRIGIAVDMYVRAMLTPGGRKMAYFTDNVRARGRRFFAALKANGVVPHHPQVLVALPDISVRTEVDVVGTDCQGGLVAIELKNTQYTVAAHRSKYAKHRTRHSTALSNECPNTEQGRHALQAAFGAVCIATKNDTTVRAAVVVVCVDGADFHWVDQHWVALATFPKSPSASVAAEPSPRKKGDCLPWPLQNCAGVRAALDAMAGTRSMTITPVAACRGISAVFSNAGGTRVVVVGIGPRQTKETQVGARRRRLVREAVVALAQHHSESTVRGVFVTPDPTHPTLWQCSQC